MGWGPNWFIKWSIIVEHVTFIIYAISLEFLCISFTYWGPINHCGLKVKTHKPLRFIDLAPKPAPIAVWGNWFIKWSIIVEHVTFIIYAISLEFLCISFT
jgi:hypothetical protein